MSHFSLAREGSKVSVTMGAELTVPFVPELRELLGAIHDDGVQELVLDFSETTVLDAAGLGLLLAARNSFSRSGRTLKLARVRPPIFSLFETLRLEQRLNAQVE